MATGPKVVSAQISDGDADVVWTVPSGETWVFRQLHVAMNDLNRTLDLSVKDSGGTTWQRWTDIPPSDTDFDQYGVFRQQDSVVRVVPEDNDLVVGDKSLFSGDHALFMMAGVSLDATKHNIIQYRFTDGTADDVYTVPSTVTWVFGPGYLSATSAATSQYWEVDVGGSGYSVLRESVELSTQSYGRANVNIPMHVPADGELTLGERLSIGYKVDTFLIGKEVAV